MKLSLTYAALFAATLTAGCQGRTGGAAPPPALTSEQQESARREIAGRIDEIIRGASQLDVEAALKPYSSDSGFTIVNPDGTVADYATMKRAQAEAMQSMASLTFTTTREAFTFLAPDLVICTWVGRNQFVLKSGEQMKIDPYVGSMTFRKTGGEWKIIYALETAAAPVVISAGK